MRRGGGILGQEMDDVEAGTTQRDVVRLGVATIPVSFTLEEFLRKWGGMIFKEISCIMRSRNRNLWRETKWRFDILYLLMIELK